MKNIFTPEDFDEYVRGSYPLGMKSQDAIAYFANVKINKLIESWPVVYGWANKDWNTDKDSEQSFTHKASLAFIEEMPKEPCKHEPEEYEFCFKTEGYLLSHPGSYHSYESDKTPLICKRCKHCGVELIAEWRAK